MLALVQGLGMLLFLAFVYLGDGFLWFVWFLLVCAVALCILALILLAYELGFSLVAVMVGQGFLVVSVCFGLAVAWRWLVGGLGVRIHSRGHRHSTLTRSRG
jgi:hypothetical protein